MHGTIVTEDAASEAGRTRRDGRYAARYTLWDESSIPRVRACGRFAFDGDAGVQVRVRHDATGSHAAFAGAQTCGSVWACPVCAEKVQSERQREVQAALEEAHRRGWVVAFATFTVRHRGGAGRSLRKVWGAASTAWRAAGSGSGRRWKDERADAGIVGYIRLFETTQGRTNGWHVHVHALVFADPQKRAHGIPSEKSDTWALLEDVTRSMFGRWREALRGTDYMPSTRHGFDVRQVHAGDELGGYFAKGVYQVDERAASYEVTSSHTKQAAHGNRTPFALLADLVRHGDADDLDLWHEWERVSKGKRQMYWSPGLRDLLDVGAEMSDEQIAEQAVLEGHVVDWISPREYRRLASLRLLGECLRAAEHDDDGERLCAFLNRLGPPLPV